MGSTGYRFLRYYTGSANYRRKGPPAAVLRMLAPAVVLTTAALFGTGVWVLLAGPENGAALTLHKASFIAWFALMTAHVLGHLIELPGLASSDWRRAGGREARLAGAGLRIALLGGSLLAGLALAMATFSLADPWLSAAAGG
jgi:hypothetical protein